MIPRILTFFLIACSCLWSENLRYGMSSEDVRTELGRPDSKMSMGEKEVWIYADGSRMEFVDGSLSKENDTTLAPPKAQADSSEVKNDPLIKAEDIVQEREDKTISASIQPEEIDLSNLVDSYSNSDSLKNLQDELMDEQGASSSRPKSRIQEIASAFVIELVVTLLVLSIAFQISGFPSVLRQLLLLSLAVGIVGVLLDILVSASPLNPIRSGLGFIVLLLLIRPLTDVREWATAIKIAIIARLVSIAIIWVIMLGLSMLLSL